MIVVHFLPAISASPNLALKFMRHGKLSQRTTNHVRGYDASAPSRALASFRSHVSKPSVNQL